MVYFFLVLCFLALFIVLDLFFKQRQRSKKIFELTQEFGKREPKSYINFDYLSRFIDFKKKDSIDEVYQFIDDQTVNDLGLNELFILIDNTITGIGQQFLYFRFRAIFKEIKFKNHSVLSNTFLKNKNLSLKVAVELSNLSESSSLIDLLDFQFIKKPGYVWLLYFLSLSSFMLIFFGFFNPVFFLLLIPIFLINTFFYYKNKWEINRYSNAISQLEKSYAVANKLLKVKEIKSYFKEVQFIVDLKSILIRSKIISFEHNFGNEINIAFWLIMELLKILFNIESIVFYGFIDSIIAKRKSIESLSDFIGEIDSSFSIASYKFNNNNICVPKFHNSKRVEISDLRHPFISDCVVNDVLMNGNGMIITGSNMSGKTSYIRAIGINAILSQTLNFCFAKSYTSFFTKVLTSIRNSDSARDGKSFYMQEVLRLKHIIDVAKINKHCLIIIDEIFKGTNTIERIIGSRSILKYLSSFEHNILVTTHDSELTKLLKDFNFFPYYFSGSIENGQLKFDYKLEMGVVKNSNALKILEIHNFPDEIIEGFKDVF